MQKHALSWFQIPVVDFERARDFYSKLLEYEMPILEMGDSTLGLLPFDESQEGVGGAIQVMEGRKPVKNGSLVFLNCGEDLAVPLARVELLGGRVVVDKTPLGEDDGFYAVFDDPEGNRVGLYSDH